MLGGVARSTGRCVSRAIPPCSSLSICFCVHSATKLRLSSVKQASESVCHTDRFELPLSDPLHTGHVTHGVCGETSKSSPIVVPTHETILTHDAHSVTSQARGMWRTQCEAGLCHWTNHDGQPPSLLCPRTRQAAHDACAVSRYEAHGAPNVKQA